MRGKAHSDAVKAQVMAALLAGQGVTEAAETYKLPVDTVRTWAYKDPRFKEVHLQKRRDFDELITNCTTEILTTLSFFAERARDTSWFEKQPADELAVYIGVLTDKAIRFLAARQPEEAEQPAGGDSSLPPMAGDG